MLILCVLLLARSLRFGVKRSIRRTKCARKIQHWFRRRRIIRTVSMAVNNAHAAITIQRVFRGHLGRLIARWLRKQLKAAIDIQRVYRCVLCAVVVVEGGGVWS